MAGKEADDLLHFVSGITGDARLRIEENLPHGFVRLKVAEAERRQAQHDIRCVEDKLARCRCSPGLRRLPEGAGQVPQNHGSGRRLRHTRGYARYCF